ncbi:hypothetical protein JD844_027084 [Phrynosoma platyrhinos]|uniref:Uncharacterized protein n=1 Tax=Phrynosoma platyrhinos TaxID=52577 RepID=A0ABQ7SFR5_PHRPL|nr:hypothetical protein JD844_027084 [Phrynosoma platyrhinos]
MLAGVETFSPRGKLTSLKSTPGSWTTSGKLTPKPKVPVEGPGFRRTSSISSISSTQSDQSICSNNYILAICINVMVFGDQLDKESDLFTQLMEQV